MGASKAVIIQDVELCDICGARGFEECLAVCTLCNERAEHVYCMQTLCDAVPLNWVCEGCNKSIVLESGEVQSERDSCANSMTDDFKENENIKTRFSQKNTSAKTSGRPRKHDNNRQGSEEFETETTIEAEHLSDGVSKKLSCLILSAEDGLSACTSDESASKSQTDCSSPATPHDQSDLERVCCILKVGDGVKTSSNPQLNDSSAVDAPEYFTKPPVTSDPPPTSSSSLSTSPLSGFCLPLSRGTEHVLPLKEWNSLPDSVKVIDMEIGDKDVDSGNNNGNAQESRTQKSLGLPSLPLPNQPALSWTLLEPRLPPDSPPVQPSPPAIPLESGTEEESPLPPLPPDSPPMQPSPPKKSSGVVNCTHSLLPGSPPAQPSPPVEPSPPAIPLESGTEEESPPPPLPPDSPPKQPSPPKTPSGVVNCTHSQLAPLPPGPKTPCDQFNVDNDRPGSPSAPPSGLPAPPQSHQNNAPGFNLDSSAVSKPKSPGQEGDCSMRGNLESLASRLDKKRPRHASCAENIITSTSRKALRYGFPSDIFEILLDVAEPSRSKKQAPSKQDLELESHRQSNDSAVGPTPLCPTASSDQQVKDEEKNASSVGQLRKDSLKSPDKKLLDKAPFVASKIRTESGLKSNEEQPHLSSSDSSTRSCSDLPCPSIVEQAIPKQGKEDNRLVPWRSWEDGQVAQRSSMNAGSASASSSILNGVSANQDIYITADIIRCCMDEDLISKVGGDCNVDDARTCENARDNVTVQQVSCPSLFPALESSSAFDRTGILVDLFSEHELLSDLNWQVMPLVQQLEKPWYNPPLPNLNDPPFPSSLDKSLIALPDEDFALTLRLPQYRKHGNIWITVESDTRTCYDENVKLSLSCCTL